MTKSLFFVFALSLSSFATDCFGFDGKRQGFIINLGSGLGSIGDNRPGLGLTIKIGYGIHNRFAIHFNSSSVAELGRPSEERPQLRFDGLGATIYFAESAPSGFLSGAIGQASYRSGLRLGWKRDFGLNAGGGYEFMKNWSFSVVYSLGKIEGLNRYAMIAKINHLWY